MRPFAIALLLALGASRTAGAEDAANSGLVVIDLRPAEEKEGFGLAELDGKCNKDVFRIPDVATDPLKVDLLKAELERQLTDSGAGKTLTVLNWAIYYNKQVQGGGGKGLSSVGVGGYSVPTGKKKERRPGSDCARRDTAGGWYEGSELKSNYFPLVSEFTGTFAGKPVSVRLVHSPRRKIDGKFDGAATDSQELSSTVEETVEAVLSAIAQ